MKTPITTQEEWDQIAEGMLTIVNEIINIVHFLDDVAECEFRRAFVDLSRSLIPDAKQWAKKASTVAGLEAMTWECSCGKHLEQVISLEEQKPHALLAELLGLDESEIDFLVGTDEEE